MPKSDTIEINNSLKHVLPKKDAIRVNEFYEDANIFITGATGFVGIALIEKLLRTFPKIGTLYLLMRPKKSLSVHDRLDQLKKNKIFNGLREMGYSDALEKLSAISGDVGDENLGLSVEDRNELKDNVHVVFHCAATLDFEANIVTTTNINLKGTRQILSLCQECSKLKAIVHVSSAYVNADKKIVEEILYDPPGDSEKILELVQLLDKADLEIMTDSLIGKHPNTYTFTKALAEHEVAKYQQFFPTAIVRPSMILGSWKEPLKGWTISKNGPQGFLMGAAKGVIRRLPLDKNLTYDYIPVDVVINSMITSAWFTSTYRLNETPIFHCTTSTSKPFQWAQIESQVNSCLHKHPLKSAVWYPNLKFLRSILLFRISSFIFHLLPGIIFDGITKLSGGRPILVRMHRNVNRSLGRLAPFIFNEWTFHNHNTYSLQGLLNDQEREKFYLDTRNLDWKDFFLELALGVRTYLNNENSSTLTAARKKNKILYILNWGVQILVVGMLWLVGSYALNQPMIHTVWIVFVTILFGYVL